MEEDRTAIATCIRTLPPDVQDMLTEKLLGPKAGSLDLVHRDARITLQLVLAKAAAKGMDVQQLAWPSLAAAIVLLAARDKDHLEARARCGFSHRELYWSLESDMYGFHTGGVTGARRFGRCLPCAIGKPGKCGAGSAAWFCRRRLSMLDTRSMAPSTKTASLLMDGVTLLPSRSAGYVLARGLDANGTPQGPSRKTIGPPPGPQDDDRVSLFDRSTWSGARLGGAVSADGDKSETFVAQARTLLDGLQGLTPEEQWREVTHACTKRYVSCLKRLAGKESRKRKLAAQGAEAQPLAEAELAASELRRWPDYAFLMMCNETDKCLPEDDMRVSPCFLNEATRAATAEMQPAAFGMPPWHLRPDALRRSRSDSLPLHTRPHMQRRVSAPLRRRSSSDSRQPASVPVQPPLLSAGAAVGGTATAAIGPPVGAAATAMDFTGPDLSAAHSHFDEFFALAASGGSDARWASGGVSNGGGGGSGGGGCDRDICGGGSGAHTFSSCGNQGNADTPAPFLVGQLTASHGVSGQSQGGSTLGGRFSGSFGRRHLQGGSGHGSHDFGCGSDLFSGSNFGGGGFDGSVRTVSDPQCGATACDTQHRVGEFHHRAADGLPPQAHSLSMPPGSLQRRTSSWESTATAAAATYTAAPMLSAAMATLAAYNPGPSISASPWSAGAHMHMGMDMPMCPPGVSPQQCCPRAFQTGGRAPQHPYGRSKRSNCGTANASVNTGASAAAADAATLQGGLPALLSRMPAPHDGNMGGFPGQLQALDFGTDSAHVAAPAADGQQDTPAGIAAAGTAGAPAADASGSDDICAAGKSATLYLQQAAAAGGDPASQDTPAPPASAPARADSLAAGLARQDSPAVLLRQDSAGKWDGGTAPLGHQDSLAALLSQSSLGKLFRQESLAAIGDGSSGNGGGGGGLLSGVSPANGVPACGATPGGGGIPAACTGLDTQLSVPNIFDAGGLDGWRSSDWSLAALEALEHSMPLATLDEHPHS